MKRDRHVRMWRETGKTEEREGKDRQCVERLEGHVIRDR